MADEAFALSPISARAALPSEADYEAISAAFMETSRGRWFLSEYARRNRNADTRMVLDAVARIEQNLAAQKDAAPDPRLAEALGVLRQAVDEAKAAAFQALEAFAAEDKLAPIRGAAHAIRDILERLREIGADGRIYDLMDSQVGAIEADCAKFSATDIGAALNAAFDLIGRQVARLEGDAGSSATSDAALSAATEAEEIPAADMALCSEDTVEVAEPRETVAGAPFMADDGEAQDDAVLDLIAMEMAAADFSEHEADQSFMLRPDQAVSQSDAPLADATTASPSAAAPQPSLGDILIAQGIVRPRDLSAADPLAPIRRMSQAEKIAFFS
jgi:hypothetical protein